LSRGMDGNADAAASPASYGVVVIWTGIFWATLQPTQPRMGLSRDMNGNLLADAAANPASYLVCAVAGTYLPVTSN
jgi:hypothetical protein